MRVADLSFQAEVERGQDEPLDVGGLLKPAVGVLDVHRLGPPSTRSCRGHPVCPVAQRGALRLRDLERLSDGREEAPKGVRGQRVGLLLQDIREDLAKKLLGSGDG